MNRLLLICVALGMVPGSFAAAQENKVEKNAPPARAATNVQAVNAALSMPANASQDDIARFCRNIDAQAQDARFELQMRQLDALRGEIDSRIKMLEEKRKGYEDWLARRNAFLVGAQNAFVGIVSRMRPDAAAAQLALVDEMAAASIIFKLDPRVSSAIMNEMQPEKSARLMRILVSAQKVPAGNAAPQTAATP